jgi:hypothetical protein
VTLDHIDLMCSLFLSSSHIGMHDLILYSTLPFPPAVQTYCLGGEDGYEEFFDEEF